MSLREDESLGETAYLVASPANACRLNEAVQELRDGGGELRELIDADAGPTPGEGHEIPTAPR